MTFDPLDMEIEIECWACGGEGTVADCEDDIGCVDPESGCDLCMRRCDVCGGKGSWEREEE